MAPEQRRQHLIGAVIPLLAQQGGELTTAQIANAAGVSEGTIFRLFEDKQALMDEALKAALDPTQAADDVRGVLAEAEPLERLSRAADRIRHHFRTALPLMHAALRQGPKMETSMAIGHMFQSLLGATEQLFSEEIEAGRVRGDAQELARMLVGMCQAVVWQDFFDRGPHRMETTSFVGVLLDGCRA